MARHAIELIDGLNHVHGNSNGAGLVGNGPGNRLPNPPSSVGGKLITAAIFKFIDRLHQANIAFLDEVEEQQAAIGVLLGDGNDQTQIGLHHFFLGPPCFRFTGRHPAVDLFNFRQRDARAFGNFCQGL